MENIEQSLQNTSKIVLPLFILLLIMTGVFYQYRILFVDPSAVLFTIINTGRFIIAEHRYGSFITQLFPLIGTKLNLPLYSIAFLYSISFNIFYLTVVSLLYFRYKAPSLALLLAFYFSLIVSDNFFWPNNEVHQGTAWLFLFFGIILQRKKITILGHIIATTCLFFGIFSHILVLPVLAFLWVIFWLHREEKQLSHRASIFYSVIMAFILGIKLFLSSNSSYDSIKLGRVLHPTLKMFITSFTNGHSKSIAALFITNYWLVLGLLGVGIFYLLQQKKYLLTFLTLGACTIYYALVSLTYSEPFGRELQFYMETEWMPITILATFPFVYYVLPKIKPLYTLMLLSVIFSIRLGYIFNAKELFAERHQCLALVCNKMQEKGETKLIIPKTAATDEKFVMDWATSTESILYSAINGIKPQRVFKIAADTAAVNTPDILYIGYFPKMNDFNLNARYFNIDTTRRYKVMSFEEIKK